METFDRLAGGAFVFPMRRFKWGGIDDMDLVVMCDFGR
jgi:hypothetical protein